MRRDRKMSAAAPDETPPRLRVSAWTPFFLPRNLHPRPFVLQRLAEGIRRPVSAVPEL